MNIKAISFDFWNTLYYDYKVTYERHNARKKYLRDTIDKYAYAPGEDLEPVFKYCWDQFDNVWKNQHRTLKTRELLDLICNKLDVVLPEEALLDVTKYFEEVILDDPPVLFDGAKEILPKLAGRYPLGITSDTAYSSGRVLKILMERDGVLKYFSAFSFSDEVGHSKPSPNTFLNTLVQLETSPDETAHVGDNEYTDIGGAKNSGLIPVWFKGAYERESNYTSAVYKANDWYDLAEIFDV